MREEEPDKLDRGAEIDLDLVAVVRRTVAELQIDVILDARVVDQDVQVREAAQHLVREPPALGVHTHVADD